MDCLHNVLPGAEHYIRGSGVKIGFSRNRSGGGVKGLIIITYIKRTFKAEKYNNIDMVSLLFEGIEIHYVGGQIMRPSGG